jgi:hypothetical protein
MKRREVAVQLVKALCRDMQVGSDGIQACASCLQCDPKDAISTLLFVGAVCHLGTE